MDFFWSAQKLTCDRISKTKIAFFAFFSTKSVSPEARCDFGDPSKSHRASGQTDFAVWIIFGWIIFGRHLHCNPSIFGSLLDPFWIIFGRHLHCNPPPPPVYWVAGLPSLVNGPPSLGNNPPQLGSDPAPLGSGPPRLVSGPPPLVSGPPDS